MSGNLSRKTGAFMRRLHLSLFEKGLAAPAEFFMPDLLTCSKVRLRQNSCIYIGSAASKSFETYGWPLNAHYQYGSNIMPIPKKR